MGHVRQNFILWSSLHILLVAGVDYVPPTITLESCLHETMAVTITGATAGGLLYTRSKSQAYNVQPTVDGDIDYGCTFEECNISWRKSMIQTRHDVIMIFICAADLTNIMPGDIHNSDGLYGNATVVTYKPQARMSIYEDGELLTSGSYVKLGTKVMMKLEITNNELDMFDFNVKSCKASSVELIGDKCSLDEELFPNFNKSSIATVYNYFHMFRPTTTLTGSVNIIFSCDLKICMGWCPEVDCNDTTVEKREAAVPMAVGVMLNVGLGEIEEVVSEITSRTLCVSVGLFIGTVTTFCVLLTANLTGAGICYIKCKNYEQQNQEKRANNKNAVNEKHNRCKTALEKPAQNNSHSVNIKDHEKNMVGKNDPEYINQTFSSEMQTKTPGLFNSDNEQNSTVEKGNYISNTNGESFAIVDRDLISASFKQFSTGLQVKLDESASQCSTTQRILSVLKTPTNLKPVLKSRSNSKSSVANSNMDQKENNQRMVTQKGDNSKMFVQKEHNSICQQRKDFSMVQNGSDLQQEIKGSESSVKHENGEITLAKFFSNLSSDRRRSSIFKTESKENLLEHLKET